MKGRGIRGLAVLIVLLTILSLPAVGHADAGFFSGGADYGGSSYSGGGSYDGSGSSSGGSFNPVMIFVDDEEQALPLFNVPQMRVHVPLPFAADEYAILRKKKERPD